MMNPVHSWQVILKVGRIRPLQFITFLFNFLFLLERKKNKIWLGQDLNPQSINLIKPIGPQSS